jgi:arabinofuranosyltransferase
MTNKRPRAPQDGTTPDYATSSRTAQLERRLLPFLALLVFAVVVLKNAWLSDDAFITLRTVRNWLLGFGPVWNVAERVQAYTHPLWMLVLAGAIGVTREYYFTTLLLGSALSLAAVFVLVRYLAADWLAALLAATILILSKSFIDFSTSGLENPLTHLLLALFCAVFLGRPGGSRTIFWLALLAALGAVNRLDTLLLFAPPLAYACYRQRQRWRRTAGLVALGFLPLVAWEIFSIAYYGFLFPNTYYAKLNTGVPLVESIQQGLLYLVQTTGTDLLTQVAIAVGVLLPLFRRGPAAAPERAIAAGIVLYLLYVVRIGGDHMSGRYLSAPLFCAVVILAQRPLLPLPHLATAGVFVLTLAVGLASPARSPLLSTAAYEFPVIDPNGVTDDRGGYYRFYGLLPANRLNRLPAAGAIAGAPDPQSVVQGAIGYQGFIASPYTHLVDPLALGDPLLARLPAIYNPDWRMGHFDRHLPQGYLGTLRTGQNQLVDRGLAEYYDRLRQVVAGPLWAPERWTEIWRFATGQNAALIDEARYRFPDLAWAPLQDFEQNWADRLAYAAEKDPEAFRGRRFDAQGVLVELGATRHARRLDLQFEASAFDVVYRAGEQEVGRQTVMAAPLRLDGDVFTVVDVPATTAQAGYDRIQIIPRLADEYELRRVGLFDEVSSSETSSENAAADHVADLLRQYYHAFYRGPRDVRAGRLADLLARLRAAPPAEWETLPTGYRIDLLRMPAPELRDLLLERLPAMPVLTDAAGNALLCFVGFMPEAPTAGDTAAVVRGQLVFEVLAPFAEDYTLWFHLVGAETAGETPAEFMVYDYPDAEKTTRWPPGALYEVPVALELAPGDYETSFGLWTPDRRRLYVDQANDVYWINLGVLTSAEPAARP